jgi:hypothetical protein
VDVEYLLGSMLRGVLTSRGHRKKMKGASRFLLGNPRVAGKGALVLGGLAYALYESLAKGHGIGTMAAAGSAGASSAGGVAATPGAGQWSGGSAPGPSVVPPPLPFTAAAGMPVVPPPLPREADLQQSVSPALVEPDNASAVMTPDVLRVVRLSISAAHADGSFTSAERAAIGAQARQAGVEALVSPDLARPPSVAEILGDVPPGVHRQHLYMIAFAIVRADETVTPGERTYLREVAAALALDVETVAQLERDATEHIDRAAREPDVTPR